MKKRFKKIYIEITNICNLQCPFCEVTKREKEYMKEQDFLAILEKIKPYTDYIYLHVKGEPLLHPDINEFIEMANKVGIQVNLTTNGTHMDHLKTNKVRQINYSMQSASSAEEARKILRNIREYTKGNSTYVSIRLWSDAIKQDTEMKTMLEEEFEKGIEWKDKTILDKNVFLSMEEEFQWPGEAKGEQEEGYCYALKDQIAILVDGSVVPCCLDGQGEIILGNIKTETIEEILEKDRTKAMIEGFKKRKAVETLCKNCTFKNRFA